MSLETGTYISDLVSTNPTASDAKSQGDDHLRLLKSTIKATFPNVSGAVTPTHTELNFVDGVTSAIQTQIDTKGAITGQTWTGTHAFAATTSIGNVSAAEIAYLDGVTSAIQTQIDTKAPSASPTLTGNVTVPTPSAATDAANKSYVDGVAFSSALPGQTGNAGKFVTTDGTNASWAFAGISQVTTATTATTLTSTPTLLQITPTSYGVTVTLPDATTCSVGGPLHCIDNRGAYPVRVCNTSGTLLGFVFAGVVSYISLDDNSTAAGVWAISSNELVGASAQLLTTSTLATVGIGACVDIGSSRELLVSGLAGNTYSNLTAVVYDRSTNTWGTPTVIRAGLVKGVAPAVLSAANQVLVVSCSNSTAFEAVTLSISGTTITVNTAATATLSANLSDFADGCGLIAVTGGFVTSYTVATPAAQLRGMTISGTTVSISAASVLDGTAGGLIAATADKVIAASTATTNLYTKPYTLSAGPTLTAGTGTTTASGTMTLNKLAALGSRWVVLYNDGGTTVRGGVVSLSGTTTTISVATLIAAGTLQDAIVVGSDKVLVLNNQTTNNANILTDTAGTASAGTAITLSSGTTRYCQYVNGTDVLVANASGVNTLVSCSGASPTSQRVGDSGVAIGAASNAVLLRSPTWIYGSRFVSQTALSTTIYGIWNDVPLFNLNNAYTGGGTTCYRGKADSERWVADATRVITKIEAVV